MKNTVRHALAVLALAVTMIGGSVAVASAAPNVVGMTYDKAKAAVSQAGLTAEVSTSVGTELQQGDCVVAGQGLRPASTFGQQSVPSKVLLFLNCNASIASATQAGNSAASPEGQKAKKEQAAEEWRANTTDGQTWCTENKRLHPQWDWSQILGCST
ncbi:PASTA domain-containing protein [Mycolicibacterium sp. 050158]|uniref:PASTA domain-containing protein n=1 Tax=Mycolicibacterium sp. 050158 TaxID=3090602 RepID=UPI00299E7D1C|nr:PASTA domain-containing protein [Mycolicibacterium sp. 050158]MDX1888191.1 PASTA domain-containing protein [Mycolicibacterium sp. 050158]